MDWSDISCFYLRSSWAPTDQTVDSLLKPPLPLLPLWQKWNTLLQAFARSRKSPAEIKKTSNLLLGTWPEGWPLYTMSLWRWKVMKPLTTGAISAPRKTKTTPNIVAAVAADMKGRPVFHPQGYHLCLWGCPMGQSTTSSEMTKGSSRSSSFMGTMLKSPMSTLFRCAWLPTRSSCFSNPSICWIWLLQTTSSYDGWRRSWWALPWLGRASRRPGKWSNETLVFTSSSFPSGSN